MEELTAQESVCAEIQAIMETRRRQQSEGVEGTPGGLEHMGDVWRLLARWDKELSEAPEEDG